MRLGGRVDPLLALSCTFLFSHELCCVLPHNFVLLLLAHHTSCHTHACVHVVRLVSRAGCGVKGEKLRQFCCINSRPVELPRAIKTLNDTYK